MSASPGLAVQGRLAACLFTHLAGRSFTYLLCVYLSIHSAEGGSFCVVCVFIHSFIHLSYSCIYIVCWIVSVDHIYIYIVNSLMHLLIHSCTWVSVHSSFTYVCTYVFSYHSSWLDPTITLSGSLLGLLRRLDDTLRFQHGIMLQKTYMPIPSPRPPEIPPCKRCNRCFEAFPGCRMSHKTTTESA